MKHGPPLARGSITKDIHTYVLYTHTYVHTERITTDLATVHVSGSIRELRTDKIYTCNGNRSVLVAIATSQVVVEEEG